FYRRREHQRRGRHPMPDHPQRPTDAQVITEVANVYSEETNARAVLDRIGYPRIQIPNFAPPGPFWQNIAHQLQAGILRQGGGLRPLLEAAAETYPGNQVFQAWLGPVP